MSIDAPTRLSPDELLMLPDQKFYELVNGELVELKMSTESSWIAGQIFFLLRSSLQLTNLAWVFPEGTGFCCFSHDPNRVRKPDASLITYERLPRIPSGRGYQTVAPDLAVEVVSPHDVAYDVNEKVDDWLEAGTNVVWLVMPRDRTVTVYAQGQKPVLFVADEEISLACVPDFRCHVSEFFPPKLEAPPSREIPS